MPDPSFGIQEAKIVARKYPALVQSTAQTPSIVIMSSPVSIRLISAFKYSPPFSLLIPVMSEEYRGTRGTVSPQLTLARNSPLSLIIPNVAGHPMQPRWRHVS